jgi:hypothetical protein
MMFWGFDIPVNQAALVGVAQGFCDLGGEVQGLLPAQYAALFHVLLECNASMSSMTI